jgi:hypothetical protein
MSPTPLPQSRHSWKSCGKIGLSLVYQLLKSCAKAVENPFNDSLTIGAQDSETAAKA